MQRRRFLMGAIRGFGAVGALGVCTVQAHAQAPQTAPMHQLAWPQRPIAPVRASADRIIALDVCTRPFRARGPRIEVERFGRKTVVHNYGHGGSGWSLSWGAARRALALVHTSGERDVAVIGCGAIGITTAVLAQRQGRRVRIYTKDRLPEVRSSWATGVWSPDSRICTQEHATPGFEREWEAMARYSFRSFQDLLGLAGDPVEWRDGYAVSETRFGAPEPIAGEPAYPRLNDRLLRDLRVLPQDIPAGQHPFQRPYVRRTTRLMFNISAYSRLLINDFLVAGGQIEAAEFRSSTDFARVREKVIVNATGFGARALLGDESLIAVRGQTARLIPQSEVDYSLNDATGHVSMTPRRDGLVVQASLPGDFDNDSTQPERAVSEAAVARLGALFAA